MNKNDIKEIANLIALATDWKDKDKINKRFFVGQISYFLKSQDSFFEQNSFESVCNS